VDARHDLPGYSDTQETEALGLLVAQSYLIRSGFKVTEINGRFDDGLDLLVSPHDKTNVLPAIAGFQVRSRLSHQGLKVGRHESYWRELNLPVFGIVLSDPRSSLPKGSWCDAQAYLRVHGDVRVIPTPNRFPEGLAEAVHAANEGRRSVTAALDVFSQDRRWQRPNKRAGSVPDSCQHRQRPRRRAGTYGLNCDDQTSTRPSARQEHGRCTPDGRDTGAAGVASMSVGTRDR
jgi:hypothetical protein